MFTVRLTLFLVFCLMPVSVFSQNLFKGVIAGLEKDTAKTEAVYKYSSYSRIITIDSTCKKKYLTPEAGVYGFPAFSPDAKKILFGITRDTIVYDLNLSDNPNLKKLGDKIYDDTEYPMPSKDGKGTVFVITDIWIMNPDGTGKLKLSDSRKLSSAKDPRWSPDGKKIIYTSYRPFGLPQGEIWEMNIETKTEKMVKIELGKYKKDGMNYSWPDYSPDGRYFVFTASVHGENHLDIFLKDTFLNKTFLFYPEKKEILKMKWSPNSERILIHLRDKRGPLIFWSDKIHIKDLYYVDSDIKARLVEGIKNGTINAGFVDWSPDGREVALSIRDVRKKNSELWIFDKDFSSPRKILEFTNIGLNSWGGYQKPLFTKEIKISGTEIVQTNRLIYAVLLIPFLLISYILYGKMIKTKIYKEDVERNRKDLMLLLRDFSHTGMSTKIVVNLEYCLKNIYAKGEMDHELVKELKKLVVIYRASVDKSIKKIAALGKKTLPSKEKFVKIERINSKINAQMEKINSQYFISGPDETFLLDLSYLIESLELNFKKIFNELNSYFKADVLEICQNLILTSIDNSQYDYNINLIYTGLSENNAVISGNDLIFILENLISNSVKAMKDSEEKSISILARSDERRIFLEVKDTGCGIPQNRWGNIFMERDDKYLDKGYGLLRSLQLLNIYGGRLRVKNSNINKGTTMLLTLKVNN